MKRFFAVFLICLIPLTLASDTQHRFKVCVNVEAEDDDKMEGQIIGSHLKRELRALGDVDIVMADDDWEFRILVKALGHERVDGGKTPHMSIATAFHNRVPTFLLVKDYHHSMPTDMPPVYSIGGPSPYIWSKDDLLSWSILAVSKFNGFLEIKRKNR
jgi:hypothetical protein